MGKAPLPKLSWLQRFFAGAWFARLWFGGWSLAFTVVIYAIIWAGLSTWTFLYLLFLLPAIGFLWGMILAPVVWPALHRWRVRVNGGPFNIGDRVQIISGLYAGVVTHVSKPWQGVSLRVELGDLRQNVDDDIVTPEQLVMVSSSLPT